MVTCVHYTKSYTMLYALTLTGHFWYICMNFETLRGFQRDIISGDLHGGHSASIAYFK